MGSCSVTANRVYGVGCSCLKVFIDTVVAALGQFDAGLLEADALRIGRAVSERCSKLPSDQGIEDRGGAQERP